MEKKTILIVGADSYMAKTFVSQFSDRYNILTPKWDITKKDKPHIGKKIHAVIHYACISDIKACEENKDKAFLVNVTGTFNSLEFAVKKGVEKFIYISTGGVYRDSDERHTENDPKEPNNFYTLTKILSEKLSRYYSKNMKITIVRPFFPYGPGTHPDRLLARMADSIKQGKPISLNNRGKPGINPVYIDDFNHALEAVVRTENRKYSEYNIGGPSVASIKQIAEFLGRLLTKKPVFDNNGKEVFNLLSDNSRINKIFKVKTGLREGMTKTFRINREEKNVRS